MISEMHLLKFRPRGGRRRSSARYEMGARCKDFKDPFGNCYAVRMFRFYGNIMTQKKLTFF